MNTALIPLKDLAQVIRSKNAGPYEITFDVIFKDPRVFGDVRETGILNRELIRQLYGVEDADITCCMFFEPALAFKATIIRRGEQGGPGECDTFGAQQHAPLLDVRVPVSR